MKLNGQLFKALSDYCKETTGDWSDYFMMVSNPPHELKNNGCFFKLTGDYGKMTTAFVMPLRGRDELIKETGSIAFVYKQKSEGVGYLGCVRIVDPITMTEYRIKYNRDKQINSLSEITDRISKINHDLSKLIEPTLRVLRRRLAGS